MSDLLNELIPRWIHIGSSIALVGGAFYMRWALWPALMSLSADTRQAVLSAARPRWAKVVMMTSGLLLVSGLYNAVRIIMTYEVEGPNYHALVAVKLLIAMLAMGLAAVLSGRSPMAERCRQNLGPWLNLQVLLAMLLIGLAGYMKSLPRQVKAPAEGATGQETSSPEGVR